MLTANLHLYTTKIQRDLNGTRMSAVYNLIQSSLRSKRALLTHKTVYPNVPRCLKEEDYNFSIEVEVVIRISKDDIIFSQHENKINTAFGPVARRYAHKKVDFRYTKYHQYGCMGWEE